MSADQSLRTITYVLIFLIVGGGLEWLFRQYTQFLLLRLELSPVSWPKTAGRGVSRPADFRRPAGLFGGNDRHVPGLRVAALRRKHRPQPADDRHRHSRGGHRFAVCAGATGPGTAPRAARQRYCPAVTPLGRSGCFPGNPGAHRDRHLRAPGRQYRRVGATLGIAVTAGTRCAAVTVLAIWHLAWLISRRAPQPTKAGRDCRNSGRDTCPSSHWSAGSCGCSTPPK